MAKNTLIRKELCKIHKQGGQDSCRKNKSSLGNPYWLNINPTGLLSEILYRYIGASRADYSGTLVRHCFIKRKPRLQSERPG